MHMQYNLRTQPSMQPQSLTSNKSRNTLQVEGFDVSGNGFGGCVENKLIESISCITKVLEQIDSGIRADMIRRLWGTPIFLYVVAPMKRSSSLFSYWER